MQCTSLEAPCASALAMASPPARLEYTCINDVCQAVEDIAVCGPESTSLCLWQLQQKLPHVCSLAPQELPALMLLHVSSARSIMRTMVLAVPAAFGNEGNREPDIALIMKLEGRAMAIMDALIDLQVFHLQRAAALLAYSKQLKQLTALHLALQQQLLLQQQQQQQQQQQGMYAQSHRGVYAQQAEGSEDEECSSTCNLATS